MQHSLEDGIETKHIEFTKKEIQAYKTLLNLNTDDVPDLYIAKVWPSFELFKPFIHRKVLLKESNIRRIKKLKIDTKYKATLIHNYTKQIKQFRVHQFTLTISKEGEQYIEIKQIFIEQ
ncbi:protein vraC [Mammaliicoccus sp. Dog046]|uniref:protein vraC n=1 Tax=Mammaliicoccus sp. Dog046 TaxID=3034233 RepID=UPI002B25CB24|nr:protein vraC [Mammaliicoccus sp. Dog046]WQK84772.1 protein vraC [Mammaliicoccus sp. Dog046]